MSARDETGFGGRRSRLRGTAFGVINLVRGATLLVASVVAGALWTSFGPLATFAAGAVFAAITALVAAGGFGNPSEAAGADRTAAIRRP